MAEEFINYTNRVRSYEVSIWTLQDKFLSVLKWANMECKGQIQEPEITLRDDGTQEFNFTIPQFYQNGLERIQNPMWVQLDKTPLEANMHKLKVIFNKETEDQTILEFLVTSVVYNHTQDNIMIQITAEGLAFHELGKIGYKLALSETDYTNALDKWATESLMDEEDQPLNNIQFWNDLVFKDNKGRWRTNWIYEIHMDWSAFSGEAKQSDILYEEDYISSWELSGDKMVPRTVERTREKCRIIEIEQGGNIYNITQTIAEQFGVFCRYEYVHDDSYQIIGRKVIYYNNYIQDALGHIDLTYPYTSTTITRTVDSKEITTKLYIKDVEYDQDTVNIMDVEANKSKEDYILNFDYLHKIQAITDEQYAAIDEFEATIRNFNDILISIENRINVISNQLPEIEAQYTTYTNAVKEDGERYDDACAGRTALTNGGQGWKIDGKPIALLSSDTLGYYINIRWDGVDTSTLELYKTSDNRGNFSDPITLFNPVNDEFGNLTRVDHIQLNAENETPPATLYLVATYNPETAYDNIIKVWISRKNIDIVKQKKYEDLFRRYNWYLYGNRVGYARADWVFLGDSQYPPFIFWDYEDPIDLSEIYWSNKINLARLIGRQEDFIYGLKHDYFADTDIQYYSPDLYYFHDQYLIEKKNEISKFERMMGPALREGYWNPENYHDYGDLFKDNFIMDLQESNIAGSTAHMMFKWDHEKYYDSEEPLIYQAGTDGRCEQHLTIDLSSCLEQIKNRLDDICFVYYNAVNVATIQEIRNKQSVIEDDIAHFVWGGMTKPGTINTDVNSFVYKICNDDGTPRGIRFAVSVKMNETYVPLTFSNINCLSATEIAKKLFQIIYVKDPNTDENPLHFPSNYINDPNFKNATISTRMDKINTIIDFYENIYNLLCEMETHVQCAIDDYMILQKEAKEQAAQENNTATNEDTPAWDPYEPELIECRRVKQEIIALEDILMHAEHTVEEQDTTEEFYGILYSLKTLRNYLTWEERLNNPTDMYSYYRIGAGCELGWVYKTDTQTRIPVLIVTGAQELDDNTMDFIVSNHYTTRIIDVAAEKLVDKDNIMLEGGAFVGLVNYYNKEELLPSEWDKVLTVANNAEVILGATQENGRVRFNRVISPYDENSGYEDVEPQEYKYIRDYPRLYFDTLKLKPEELRIYRDKDMLKVNDHFYTLQDDRTEGMNIQGIGYYTTLRPEVIFQSGNNYNRTYTIVYTLSNVDVSIYLDALKVSEENARPKVSYEVELSVLNPDFVHTAYNRLNQIVHINDIDLQLENVSGYISTITMKLDHPWEDTIEIKNYETKFEDLFTTIIAQTEAMKSNQVGINNAVSAFTSTGLIDQEVLQSSIYGLDLSFDQGTLTIDDITGIQGESKNGGVVVFRGSGIFTATQQDSSGNWMWNSAIVPSGINANLITVGQLDTTKIRIMAGNEVRFQWNAEGLLAYKANQYSSTISVFNQEEQASRLIDNPLENNQIDYKQYVKYNEDGLFLVGEEGTYVPYPVDPQSYIQLARTVNRVEVSWRGLILRNWYGQEVFYADPNTGNLTLAGTIQANSGYIGNWTINNSELFGDGIKLIGGNSTTETAGIYLSTPQRAQKKAYSDNTVYYEYRRVLSKNEIQTEEGTEIQYTLDNIAYYTTIATNLNDTLKLTNNDISNTIYIREQRVTSVKPRYIYTGYETITSQDEIPDDNNDDSMSVTGEGTIQVKEYIMKPVNVGSGELVKVQINGQDVIYDNNTSPENNTWYNLVRLENGYTNYIEESTTITFRLVSQQEANAFNDNEEFKPVEDPNGSDAVTFSVQAADGNVTVLKGQIGPFSISTDALYNGKIAASELDNSNKVSPVNNNNNTQYTFGDVFYDVVNNPDNGIITFKRLNGKDVNFNIADTQFFKNTVSAASNITLTITTSNGQLLVNATNG